jgi:anaerobic selenocysteine-containing dehydrogenase
MVTGRLADEILAPGPGQVRFLLNHGGNPASSVPDQRKIVAALKALELLVTIDPVMSATARLSHYVLPPKLQFERPDLPIHLFESNTFPTAATRYTPAVVDPPPGSEVCDEWRVMWELARRLGKQINYGGASLDMVTPPTDDELLALVLGHAPVSLDELKRHPLGYYHSELQYALPMDPATAGRFGLMPDDVEAEIAVLRNEIDVPADDRFPFQLTNRRSRHRMNSMGGTLPELRRLMPYNVGNMNPQDMAAHGVDAGDWIEVSSEHGAIEVLAEPDETIRRGVVSISHGFGGLPDEEDFLAKGASPNALISTDDHLQTINAMPRMTAIPISIRRLEPVAG